MPTEGPSVEELRQELDGVGAPTPEYLGAPGVANLLSSAALTEVLALCGVAHTDGLGPTGLDIRNLAAEFGVTLSEGTVYPKLHDLEDEGLLDSHDLVRSIRYTAADPTAVSERLAQYEARLRWLADATREARDTLED